MVGLFCYDGPLQKDEKGNYYGSALNDEMFIRYYSLIDKLNIAIRVKKNLESNLVYKNKRIDVSNKEIIEIPEFNNLKSIITRHRKLKKILTENIKKVDLLIIRLPSIIGLYSIKIAKKLKKPYFIEMVGCVWDALWNHSIKGKLLAPFRFFSIKKIISKAPYILYVTNEFLQKRYPNKFNNIGCSDVQISIDESVLEKRLKHVNEKPENEPLILCTVGAVNVKFKGQQYVIKSIAELKKQGLIFKYKIIGGGDNTFLNNLAIKLGVEDNIIFTGALPHDKIYEELDNIDIYIQPSDTEGMPRALIEAMSRGCPSIGSNVGGIPELLDKEYLFRKKNVKDLIRILKLFKKEKIKEQAIMNFKKSKYFDKDFLNKKRKEFYSIFKKNEVH